MAFAIEIACFEYEISMNGNSIIFKSDCNLWLDAFLL